MPEAAQVQVAGGPRGYKYVLARGAICSTDQGATQSHLTIDPEGSAGKSQEQLRIAPGHAS